VKRLLAGTLAAAALVLLAVLAPAGGAVGASDPAAPYRGLGAWISLYGHEWASPRSAVDALAAKGVQTLYLETGRSSSPAAIERPAQTAEFVDEAHAQGMNIVAWYYPTFVRWSVDAARTLTTARYRTPSGNGFDGVAPDIEDPSVHRIGLRNQRLLAYSGRITRALPGYSWGAIVYPPIGLDLSPHAWPLFPWRPIAHDYAAILPMAYWRARTHTPAGADWYAAGNLAALHLLTGSSDVVVHIIGSGGTTPGEAYGFVQGAIEGGAAGLSLYPAGSLSPGVWKVLEASLGPLNA
jgi:hypothetical protein